MSVSGDDQPIRERWRRVPIPVLTRVLAVIGAVALATVVLSGCGGPAGGPGPTASSRSAAPSASSPAATPSTGPTGGLGPGPYRVTASVPVGKGPDGVAVDPGTHTVYVANIKDNTVSVIESR